jgi:predicted phosphohydrolase
MTGNLQIVDSSGNTIYLIMQQQLIYESKAIQLVTLEDCETQYLNKYYNHYKVDVNGSFIYIPSFYCVEYDTVIDQEQVMNKREYERLKYSLESEVHDVYKYWKEEFGKDIDNRGLPEFSNEYMELVKSSSNNQTHLVGKESENI